MKIPKELAEKLHHDFDFHYELSYEQVAQQEWYLDQKPYYRQKNCYCLHGSDGAWMELTEAQLIEVLKFNERFPNA